jgi:hypothetical protein
MSIPLPSRVLSAALLLFALAVPVLLPQAAAQTHASGRPRPVRVRRSPDAGARAEAGAAWETPHPTRGDAGPGEVLAQKTTDGGTKVLRFGEVEIEGRLKNPQLVFFLRRVRAEFAAGDLGHRSFLRELDDTRRDPNF